MLRRTIEHNLQKNLGRVPAVALLGARQIGKTTLAKAIAKDTSSLYLDLEAPEDLLKLSDPSAFLKLHHDKLIILDEIQRSPYLFMVLRGIIDQKIETLEKRQDNFCCLAPHPWICSVNHLKVSLDGLVILK